MKEEGYITDEMSDSEKADISFKYLQKEVVI